MNLKFILNSICHVSGVGEEECKCVVCHFWRAVHFCPQRWGGSCYCQEEMTLRIAGWKLVRLSSHCSAMFRKVFNVSVERREAAKFVLGNSISFSLAWLVQLSYFSVTNYFITSGNILFDVTVSEMHFKLVERSAAPKRHQLNVQNILQNNFLNINGKLLPWGREIDCKC